MHTVTVGLDQKKGGMARTKQTARLSSQKVECVQCGTQLERILERYSALNDKLVPSQRCADCQNCVYRCLDYKISLLDENLCAMSREDRRLTVVHFDFDGVYEINDATRKTVAKKFDCVHGAGAWKALGESHNGSEDWQFTFQRARRVKRVGIANHLKLKWVRKAYMKTRNAPYKNAGGRAWLSSQQASAACPRMG